MRMLSTAAAGGGDDYAIDTSVVFPFTETKVTKNVSNSSAFKRSVC